MKVDAMGQECAVLISTARRALWRVAGTTLLVGASLLSSATPSHAQSQSRVRVDHQLFDTLLRQHVIDGFVDYDAFARAPEFARYLASLDTVRPLLLDEDERLAYWINVYNAFTIQLIVSHKETESIRNINKALGFLQLKGPWSEPLVRAAGRRLTLDDVDHAIIRREFGEPRIHFALTCAAMGCPPLRSEAYTGERLVDQLNDQGHRFLGDSPAKNRLESQVFNLSPILTAYSTDFGPEAKDLVRSVAPYMKGVDSVALKRPRPFIRVTRFDWTLNSQAKARTLGLLQKTTKAGGMTAM